MTVFEAAFEDGEAEGIQQVLLKGAFEGAGTEDRTGKAMGSNINYLQLSSTATALKRD